MPRQEEGSALWQALQASYYDHNGKPIYHEDCHGLKWWGPHGLAESYGFEPQLVTLTDEQIQEQEQNAARALWENAMPAPEAERTANPGQDRSR